MQSLDRSKLLRVHLSLFYVASIWGINFVVMKSAFNSIDPLAFNGVRMTLATLILLVVLLWSERWEPIPLRDWLKIIGIGLIGNALFQILVVSGLHMSRPENAALMHATIPIWAALIAGILKLDQITKRLILGIALSFSGVALVVYATSGGFSLVNNGLIGDGIILTSSISWALYTVLAKDLLQRYSPVRVATLAMAAGLPAIWIVTYPAMSATDWTVLSLEVWGAIFFSGTFALAINYILWTRGISVIGPSRTAIYNNLMPVVTFLTAFSLLNQPVFLLQILGSLFVLIGVWISARSRR